VLTALTSGKQETNMLFRERKGGMTQGGALRPLAMGKILIHLKPEELSNSRPSQPDNRTSSDHKSSGPAPQLQGECYRERAGDRTPRS